MNRDPDFFFEWDEIPAGLNGGKGLMRSHWHNYGETKKLWTLRFFAEKAVTKVELPFTSCVIVYTVAHVRQRDWDNLHATFKVLGDAMVAAGILQDDKPSVVKYLHLVPERVAHFKEQLIRVEVYRVAPETSPDAIAQEMKRCLFNFAIADTTSSDTTLATPESSPGKPSLPPRK